MSSREQEDLASTELASGGGEKGVLEIGVLPVAPSPLTYAYLSEMSYVDPKEKEGGSGWELEVTEEQQRVLRKLDGAGWKLLDFVRKGTGYVGSIWVNDRTKQVVIAHRGSANAQSWATDLRSVARGKPSAFVNNSLSMLNRPVFLEYRKKGYRPSITGHSLGGFLAQLCVAQSYLSGSSSFDATYCPEISAVVFDSPGAVLFVASHIMSTLKVEQDRVPTSFNVMNFCVSPTVVSTFGNHYGSIYQFTDDDTGNWASVLTDHKLSSCIRPRLEEAEEAGKHWTSVCYRATTWPVIDISSKGLEGGSVSGAVVKGTFGVFNAIWKRGRYLLTGDSDSPTLYESAFGEPGAPILEYLRAASKKVLVESEEESYDAAIKMAMEASHSLCNSKSTRTRVGVEYVGSYARDFLESLALGKGNLGWKKELEERYVGLGDVLSSLRIELNGLREELVLVPGRGFSNVFDAVGSLQRVLRKYGVLSYNEYLSAAVSANAMGVEVNKSQIQEMLKKGVTASNRAEFRALVANTTGELGDALVMVGAAERDIAAQRGKEALERIVKGQGFTFELMCAFSAHGDAMVVGESAGEAQLAFANRFFDRKYKQPQGGGEKSTSDVASNESPRRPAIP